MMTAAGVSWMSVAPWKAPAIVTIVVKPAGAFRRGAAVVMRHVFPKNLMPITRREQQSHEEQQQWVEKNSVH